MATARRRRAAARSQAAHPDKPLEVKKDCKLKELILCGVCFTVFATALFSLRVCRFPQTKEIVLQQSLWTMRRAIDLYWTDKERSPASLQQLIDEGYLQEIPDDPVTKSNKTWVIEREKESSNSDSPPGIGDVYSGATGADNDGKPYCEY